MIARTILAASAFLSASAHAIPMIDFEGFSEGEQVMDYYAGGASSAGRIGPNYGIRFEGGSIHNNGLGGSIRGPFSILLDAMGIAADRPYFRTTMLATRWDIDGGHSWQLDANGRIVDAIWVAGTQHPYCNTKAACEARGSTYYDHDTLFGYEFNVFPEVTKISFTSNLADELLIDTDLARPTIRWSDAPKAPIEVADGGGVTAVPEPGTLALMLAAGLPLMGIGRTRLNLCGPVTGGGRNVPNHSYRGGHVSPCLPA